MNRVSTCLSCLERHRIRSNGLCKKCSDWNDSLDGTLLALLTEARPQENKMTKSKMTIIVNKSSDVGKTLKTPVTVTKDSPTKYRKVAGAKNTLKDFALELKAAKHDRPKPKTPLEEAEDLIISYERFYYHLNTTRLGRWQVNRAERDAHLTADWRI